ncbi:MAG: hypothetical protein V2I82_12440 [Halieaceae bacterium]|jgi:hypothetical protein|nr:hypothetical protein [Halieaceae bacterium]
MHRSLSYLIACTAGLALAVSSLAASQDLGVPPGDWACYGFEEGEETAYVGTFDLLLGDDGRWRSEGQFGEESMRGGGMPFLWDFNATGSWSAGGEKFTASTDSIRFLPTRGGADYAAANPRDYLRLPLSGSWGLFLEDSEFLRLEEPGSDLVYECSKQLEYDDENDDLEDD